MESNQEENTGFQPRGKQTEDEFQENLGAKNKKPKKRRAKDLA